MFVLPNGLFIRSKLFNLQAEQNQTKYIAMKECDYDNCRKFIQNTIFQPKNSCPTKERRTYCAIVAELTCSILSTNLIQPGYYRAQSIFNLRQKSDLKKACALKIHELVFGGVIYVTTDPALTIPNNITPCQIENVYFFPNVSGRFLY